jgi:hypothetical protein
MGQSKLLSPVKKHIMNNQGIITLAIFHVLCYGLLSKFKSSRTGQSDINFILSSILIRFIMLTVKTIRYPINHGFSRIRNLNHEVDE